MIFTAPDIDDGENAPAVVSVPDTFTSSKKAGPKSVRPPDEDIVPARLIISTLLILRLWPNNWPAPETLTFATMLLPVIEPEALIDDAGEVNSASGNTFTLTAPERESGLNVTFWSTLPSVMTVEFPILSSLPAISPAPETVVATAKLWPVTTPAPDTSVMA